MPDQADPSSETAYLICEWCGWVFPIATTFDDERCTECEGALLVVDDHVLPRRTLQQAGAELDRAWHNLGRELLGTAGGRLLVGIVDCLNAWAERVGAEPDMQPLRRRRHDDEQGERS